MKRVAIYTDGACRGNPGPGGWAALLCFEESRKTIKGSELATTNNRMELMAAIEGLAVLTDSYEVDLTTDSDYVRKGMTEWLSGWKKRGWKTAANKPVKNVDLWQRLERESARHTVHWHWVKGHSGHAENDCVDALANEAIDERLA